LRESLPCFAEAPSGAEGEVEGWDAVAGTVACLFLNESALERFAVDIAQLLDLFVGFSKIGVPELEISQGLY
jgi:hypothetical protein